MKSIEEEPAGNGGQIVMENQRKWWKEAVVYQIYPRSFQDSNGDGVGDLNGITERLPYLKELGIDVIWLSPVYDSPNDDNGYDIRNYRDILKEFGTLQDFDLMLKEAHTMGIKIVMDLVVNHTSDEHPWFVESKKGNNSYRDYYIWRDGKDKGEPNNWGSCFSGSAWKYDEEAKQYYLHLFSEKQPDLNWENQKVRDEVYDLMAWWLDKGVDGFRMDVISLISKLPGLPDGKPLANGYAGFTVSANGPRVHEYLKEMRRRVLDRYDTITVGECCGCTVEEAKHYASLDGQELNMVFHFEHMDVDQDKNTGLKWCDERMDLREFKKILSAWQTGLSGTAWNSLYLENHDQPRSVSRFGDDGKYWKKSAKMLATCYQMMQGTPYIYQGQELGMTNAPFKSLEDFRDLDSLNAYRELTQKGVYSEDEMFCYISFKGRDNARTPMQWDDSDNAGFTSGTPWIMVNPNYKTINARTETEDQGSIFHYYQKLIRLRKENLIIVYGDYNLLLPESRELYAYTRILDEERLLVCCNFSAQEVEFQMPEEFSGAECLISNEERKGYDGKMILSPYEAFVLLK